jgi:hypothetical protein
MPNRWTDFVKDFARRNDLTYGCAMSKPECKAEYKKKYPKPLTKKQQKFREAIERGDMEDADVNVAKKKPKKEVKEAFKMSAEDISSKKVNKEWNKQGQENIRMSLEDINVAEPPKKKAGRKQKYATEAERKQAKREQTLASNKKMADMRKEYLKQAREQLKMAKEDKQGSGVKNPCWEGYEMVGMKKKGKRKVPNCIPIVEGDGILRDIQKAVKSAGRKATKTYNKASKATELGLNQAVGFIKDKAEDVADYGKAVVFGRNDYPPKVRDILKKYGAEVITSYKIKRTPVSSLLTSALSAVSLGEFGKRFGRSEYDTLFHLFLEMTTASGKRLSVEKNEVINMEVSPKKRDKEEVEDITNNVPQGLTLDTIMDNTEKYMGKKKFFGYSARDNNCQDFIVAVLKSNNIGDDGNIAFVKQDTKELFRDLPFLRKFSNTITTIGERANVITTGAGVDEKELISSSKKKILSNNISKMPKFAKGSQEAKDHMARIRGMRGGNVIHPPMSSVEVSRPKYTTQGEGMCGGRVYCPHCETSMEGGKINIGKAFKKLGSDIKKGFNKEIARPVSSIAKTIDKKVINPAGDYITAKKGGLATDLIKYGIPAASSAVLGGLATAATGGNPVAGVAASALGSKLGAMGAKELQKKTGTGMRKGRFVKGSQEAKDFMASIRAKRNK